MYFAMIAGLMLVLPLVSIVIEGVATGWSVDALTLVGTWFVFWGIGVRLFVAGISQTVRPGFTAENILGKKDADADQIVQELGFANLSFGVVAILSLPFPSWLAPAALAGGLYLLIAGIRHLPKRNKNIKEWFATVSDLLVGVIAVFVAIATLVRG
ncbi:DUF6790 family protein [Leifsonia sp. NPDC058230]|uniref:DUF6790 family protein n=1 Tax=Leifsonia sp. NPDC058230 TaxID=3346391 RepID=UPI0036DB3D0D